MTKGIMQKNELLNLLKVPKTSNKKPLKQILLSYFKKNEIRGLDLKKIKEEFIDIELDMKKNKTSVETVLEIQKKLSKIYKKLSQVQDEKKNEKKKS
ncbi:MAG: hypothetical protein K1000chlam1_00504 [Candidatus Anoxychlamydiales bacterium]|nr:hypothetical protein [Candidatus Anoxychlamydiales bacterium]